MTETLSKPCTAFLGSRLLSSGPLIEVAIAAKNALEQGTIEAILAFDNATGRVVDFDLRGTKAEIIARLVKPQAQTAGQSKAQEPSTPSAEPTTEPRGPGRPKLGVVAREVTLLPRHWEWLAAQPGGASVMLRRLVEEARRTGSAKQQTRAAQEAAYTFMSAMAGDLPGFEEATRALFADDKSRFEQHSAEWPDDVRDYAIRLAFGVRQRLPADHDKEETPSC
jgi:hypothetical protein